MRELTKDRCSFVWTEEHEEEMEAIRTAAANCLPLRPFFIQIQIYTDASHLGIGFAFTQVDPSGNEFFVQCGSSACTPAMRNYSCMELELQAIVWAVRKCSVYLMALNSFTVYTDHRDLEGLESRELDPTPNNRILRNTEFLLSFPLKIKYLAKDRNLLADWLSRKPQPTQVPDLLPRFEGAGAIALVYEGMPLDKKLTDLIDACSMDDNYASILQVVNEGGELRGLRADHPARDFRSVLDKISTFNRPNGQCLLCEGRIVVPQGLRAQYLADLHHHHPSADSMWLRHAARFGGL